MASRRRVERLNQLFREELSRLIRRELQDPRVELVTVTGVEVSGDLRHAKVFVRTLRDLQAARAGAEEEVGDDSGDEDDAEGDGSGERGALAEALEGLRSAEGFLRGTLGRELRLRRIPELHFEADRTLERARRIEELLDRVSAADEEDDGGA